MTKKKGDVVMVTLRLSSELRDQISRLAKEKGISQNALTASIVSEYVEQKLFADPSAQAIDDCRVHPNK